MIIIEIFYLDQVIKIYSTFEYFKKVTCVRSDWKFFQFLFNIYNFK